MGSSLSSILLAFGVVYALKLIADLIRHERVKRQMPPGPPGLPFVGNMFQLTQFPFIRYAEWGQQYGPIFSLHLGGQPVVILSDFTVAADLIDRRSGLYSDRPRLVMVELQMKGLLLPLAPYGDLWRDMRKAAHEGFNVNAVRNYRRLQEQAAYRLLGTLLGEPRERGWELDIESSLAWTLLSVTYGLTLKEAREREDIVQYVQGFSSRIGTAALPGNHLVDIFPALANIPHFMNPWKILGERRYQYDSRVLISLVNEVRTRMATGTAPQSFCGDLIELGAEAELTETQLAWLCGIMYVAGVETTASGLEVFFLAMLLYPEVLRRAQQEIDAVVGRDRLPTFDDADDLPYIDAIIREVLRWRPSLPLTIPKLCSQDDFYEGFLIPKGAIVIQNAWAMHHDSKHFPDPETFNPERYLDSEGRLKESIPDTHGYSHSAFGSGRRVCVGRDLAQQSLFINIATILWGANISPSVDDDGVPVIPSPMSLVDKGLAVRPKTFPCIIKARSSNIEATLATFTEDA